MEKESGGARIEENRGINAVVLLFILTTFLAIHGTILIWLLLLLEMITSLFCIVFALSPVLFCPPPLHIIVWSTVVFVWLFVVRK